MSHCHSGTKAVKAALAANLVVATIKIIAAILTNSKAILAEGIHSVADSLNQVLLLIGIKQSQKKPDDIHNFGYGKSQFFWSLMVGVILFFLGGTYAMYEGYHKIIHPEAIEYAWVVVGILFIAAIIEGKALSIAYKEFQAEADGSNVFEYIKETTNSSVIVILLEDSAALVGLLIAFIGTILTIFVSPIFDGISSFLIGLLLTFVAFTLTREIYKLIIGESMTPQEHNEIKEQIESYQMVDTVLSIRSMYLGNNKAIVIVQADMNDIKCIDELENIVPKIKADIVRNNEKIYDVIIETIQEGRNK
jgi:cation diffusion facilitator family transporter